MQDLEKDISQANLRRGICKIFKRGPLREDLTRIPTRSPVKDLYRIMQGPLGEEFIRVCIRISARSSYKESQDLLKDISQIFTMSSHKDLYKIFTASYHKDLHKTSAKIFIQYIIGTCKSEP